jgi:hypothetical protein
MKKKVVSFIAAAAMAVTGSPLGANALYTEKIGRSDHTDYVKVESMSDERKDVYIYVGDDTNLKSGELKYYCGGLIEEKRSDRVYFNITEDADVTQINLLFKDFETENGDGLSAHTNIFDSRYGYYLVPQNGGKQDQILNITVNDARRIKEILENYGSVTDILYSTDVCSPNRGSIDLNQFVLTDLSLKTQGEREQIVADTKAQIQGFAEENGYDVTVSGKSFIAVEPNNDITTLEMLDIAEQICANFDNIEIMGIWQCTASELFGAIDLSNAVDGDSNCDERMDMADVVFIMQAFANPDRYQVTEQGRFNADMDGNGLTVGDAQTIQEMLLGLR